MTTNTAPPVVRRVSDLIGATPLLELCETAQGSRLLLKLESLNPTGSAKARMARQMVVDAERSGELRPGGRIVESTSGNTGVALAVLAAERGYAFTAVVDRHACRDKLRAMSALGAELVYVSDDGDEDLATAAREVLAEGLAAQSPNAVFTEQHNNPSNADGYAALADELAAALPDGIGHLVGAVGTGGSLCGTARVLRDEFERMVVIGVEPVGSIAFGGAGGPYYQSGTGTPPGAALGALVEYDLIDAGRKVSDRAAFATARVLARHTGLLVGGSAGGVVYEALRELARVPVATTMVTLVCDAGEKYLDSVFDDDWMRERELLDPAAEAEVAALLTELASG
ncbi:MAG TPA: cysteine synthase family protein [Solirubrobacteraceae bacterium]|jgi:cystathionine beta-synthase|nr:cysteine synthase family protein [Solirubrobacteraceae bacterium]